MGHFQHTPNQACHTFRVRVKHLGLGLSTCRVRVKHSVRVTVTVKHLGLRLGIFHSDGWIQLCHKPYDFLVPYTKKCCTTCPNLHSKFKRFKSILITSYVSQNAVWTVYWPRRINTGLFPFILTRTSQ